MSVFSIGNSVIDRYTKSEPFFSEEEILLEDPPAELYSSVEKTMPGGRGANQAVAASKAGADVTYIGKIGDQDIHSEELERKGVNVDLENYDGRSAEAFIFSDESLAFSPGDERVDAAYIDENFDRLLEADYMLLHNGLEPQTTEYLLSELEGETERPKVVFDPAPPRELDRMLGYDSVDYVTPNKAEYSMAEGLFESSGAEVIRTTSSGAETGDYFAESIDVPVVDTTGAGDSFNGYLVAGLDDGKTLEEAMDVATNAASLSVTRLGGQPAPTWREVEQTL